MGEYVCVYACVLDRLIVYRFSGICSCYGNPMTMCWAALYFTPERERRAKEGKKRSETELKRALMNKYLWCRCERKSSSIPAEWVWLYLHAFVCDNTFACLCIDMCMCECLFVLYIVVHIGLVHFMLSVNWYIYIHTHRVWFVGGGGYPPLWSVHPCLCWMIKWFVKLALKSRS